MMDKLEEAICKNCSKKIWRRHYNDRLSVWYHAGTTSTICNIQIRAEPK